jgi:hypothetical protein
LSIWFTYGPKKSLEKTLGILRTCMLHVRQELSQDNFFILRVSNQYGSKTSFLVAVWNSYMIKNISNNLGFIIVIPVLWSKYFENYKAR